MSSSENFRSTRYSCYLGYVTQAVIINLAPIVFIVFQNQYGLTYEQIGRLILINFVTQLTVDVLSVRYLDRFGHRRAAVLAHLMAALGLISMGLLPQLIPAAAYGALTFSVILYAIGGGVIEVLISPLVESLPGDKKAGKMSLLHSFYCWGQLLTVLLSTLILRLIGQQWWFVLPLLWALVPLYNLYRFTWVPMPQMVTQEQAQPLRQVLSSRLFWLFLLLMICSGASELAMSQWSSLFAEKGLQVDKTMGDLLGPCLFALLMGTGRTINGMYADRWWLEKMLLLSGLMCTGCYLLTALSGNPALSLAGCALCGLSVSLMWPGVYSLAAARFPLGGTGMFALLAVFGDLGCSLGPWFAGTVSDLNLIPGLSGLHSGIAAATLFPIIMVFGLLAMLLRRRRTTDVGTSDS